jgi:hypothetical protein
MMAKNEPNIQIKTRLFAGRHLCGSVLSFAYSWLCDLAPANAGRRRRYANAYTDGVANSYRLTNSDPCGHRQALCHGY